LEAEGLSQREITDALALGTPDPRGAYLEALRGYMRAGRDVALEIRRGRFEARTAAHAACRRLKHAVSSREQRQLAKVSLCAVGARLRLKTHRV
jgi:hypothetical protein